MEEFKKYFDEFYGDNGIYPDTFENGYTQDQFELAYALRVISGYYGDGDTFDREAVRDTILASIRPIQ
jgi:hypothetical protein